MWKNDEPLRQTILQEINGLKEKLDAEDDFPRMQIEIADLIFKIINFRIGVPNNWEKFYYANAIGSLGVSVDSSQRSASGWLRMCLSDLKEGLKPEADQYHRFDAQSITPTELSSKQLLKALES